MKTESTSIELPKDTYIADIEPFKSKGIPSNSIIHKEVTGCGITTFEYRIAEHHSIIILPNVPVIESKVAEHNKDFPDQEILGVHKGIDVQDIKVYLLKDIKYKKILTTPEGFVKKVLKAFENKYEEMVNDFFLLYDECERVITDVSYRGKIAAPFDIFFDFKDKALVSATTLPFSDDRFEDFEHFKITPMYDFSQPLTVINTNNVFASVKSKIDEMQSEHVCIFINSTNGILGIIEMLNIKSVSKAYCAQESVAKLMMKKYMNASDALIVKDMAKYNLFTSRYFSAIDIKLDYKPDVIMVTDIFFADHSILDPHTEIIQIAGRFRNGVKSLTHITNFNPLMEVKTQQEALSYRLGCLDTYDQVVALFEYSTEKGSKDTLEFFVENSPMASFYTKGKRNPFMIDNDLNEERVKGYYLSKENLKAAYDEIKLHFVTTFEDEDYPIRDNDMYNLSKCETKIERNKHIAALLDRYTASPGSTFFYISQTSKELKRIFVNQYPVIAEAVRLVGLDYLEKVGYETATFKKVIKDAKFANETILLAPYVHATFSHHSTVPERDIVSQLAKIYVEQSVPRKVSASHIQRFFYGNRTTKGGINAYILTEKKIPLPIHKM